MGRATRPAPNRHAEAREGAGSPQGQAPPPTWYTLRSLRPGQRIVAADLATWGHLHEVIDTEGPDARFSTAELFVIEKHIRVQVIRRTATWAEIRVLEGPSMGRTGFVAPESV